MCHHLGCIVQCIMYCTSTYLSFIIPSQSNVRCFSLHQKIWISFCKFFFFYPLLWELNTCSITLSVCPFHDFLWFVFINVVILVLDCVGAMVGIAILKLNSQEPENIRKTMHYIFQYYTTVDLLLNFLGRHGVSGK